MNTFFTADTHFGHANIIRYCHRPWVNRDLDLTTTGEWKDLAIARKNADTMDEALIANWNAVVGPKDLVYHLGDFSFGGVAKVRSIIPRLQFSQMFFLWGNHDKDMRQVKNESFANVNGSISRVKFLGSLAEVSVEGQRITLCHYAMRVWNKSHRGAWHLYGHSHGSLPDDPHALSLDVGIDVHGYRPITFEEVAIYMAKKEFKPIDHHGE